MTAKIKEEYNSYLDTGRNALNMATEYLHNNCDNWNEDHEYYYRGLLNTAQNNLVSAMALQKFI